MQTADVNGVKLEYEVIGAGDPVLLISPVVADGFLPFASERTLTDRHQLIRYHKRGWVGSTHTQGPVSVAEHALDAVALLDHLGIPRAHVAGHSSGGAVAVQLALDCPERVHSLCLLELSLLSVPSGDAFFRKVEPAFEAYKAGRPEAAIALFMAAVSGLDWEACRAVVERRIPGAAAQAIVDADTFFGVELPALMTWTLRPEQAKTIRKPVLSILGSKTEPLWFEVADRLREWLPDVEECRIEGVGHLLHIQESEPVARGIADFLRRHPIKPS